MNRICDGYPLHGKVWLQRLWTHRESLWLRSRPASPLQQGRRSREFKKWAFDGNSWDMKYFKLVVLSARGEEDECAICECFTEENLSEWPTVSRGAFDF